MTKYPSLDRYLSPLSPIMCTAPPPPPIFLQPILNHHSNHFQIYIPIFLISRVCITFFRNENKHRRFSQAFHDSSRRRGSEERGENELERQRRRATTSRATHRARAFSPENPCSVSLFFKDAGTNPGRRSWWTDVGPPGASTNNGATVTGTRYIVSRESLITETLWSMTR